MESVLLGLAVLACPVGMGLMMWFMAKGMRSGSKTDREATSVEDCRPSIVGWTPRSSAWSATRRRRSRRRGGEHGGRDRGRGGRAGVSAAHALAHAPGPAGVLFAREKRCGGRAARAPARAGGAHRVA